MIDKLKELELREKPGLTPAEAYKHLEGFNDVNAKTNYALKLLSKRRLYSLTTEESLLTAIVTMHVKGYIHDEKHQQDFIDLGGKLKKAGYVDLGNRILNDIKRIIEIREIEQTAPTFWDIYIPQNIRNDLMRRRIEAADKSYVENDIHYYYIKAANEHAMNPEPFDKLKREHDRRVKKLKEGLLSKINFSLTKKNDNSDVSYQAKLKVDSLNPSADGFMSWWNRPTLEMPLERRGGKSK